MKTSRREEWLDFWERRTPVLTALPYVMLTLCTAFAVLTRGSAACRSTWRSPRRPPR